MSDAQTPELRAEKYNADDRDEMAKSGEAMPDGSYPIKDQEDLENAIHAVGRGGSDHDAIRKHIIARAKALGHSDMIPDNWGADGSLKQQNSAVRRRSKERHRAVPLIPEIRVYATEGLEIREADTAGNLITITGAPIIYDQWYSVVDRKGEFQERMLPGVAKDVLGTDTRFLFNHDPDKVMARSTSGTLKLEDTPTELRMVATVDIRQSYTNDLVIAIERGDVNQMSVGFLCDKDEWNRTRDERSVKHFKTMPDVSSVTYPASPTTSVEIAQRMALAAGAEPGARIRRLYADYRAGAVLNAKLKGDVIDAVKGLHGVLQAAGFDPAELIEGDGDVDDKVADLDESVDGPMGATDDAAIGGNALPAGDGAGPDARAEVDPGESMRAIPPTAAERRAASESFNDQQQAVYQALLEKLGDGDGDCDLWIMDCADDWAVYQSYLKPEGIFKVGYSTDADGNVTLDGDPMRVNVKTTYEPAEDDAQARTSSVVTELRAQYRAREYRRRTAA